MIDPARALVRYLSSVRTLVILSLAIPAIAAADPPPAFKLVEDAALGTQLQPDHPLLGNPAAAAITRCTAAIEPSSGALFWLEISRSGAITAARVHGSGKPEVDTCLAAALRKTPVAKLPAPIVLAGHIDLKLRDGEGLWPTPRQSTTSVLVAAHDAKWQLTVNHLAYTANRAADIAAALDGASTAIAACAPRRGSSAAPAEAIVWYDGKAIVRSGTPAYDTCVAKAIDTVTLPAPESALWMKLAIMPPGEPLAPLTDKGALSREQGLRDALTTTVRSRKALLLACLDGHAKAALSKVGVELRAGKASIKTVSTGDAEADRCVRQRLAGIAIPNANPDDKLELEVTLERQ
ncbi:MAG: hypothetical protein H6Q90_1748 [Deltaproteobacteria bacterium]|nr:hypothetical protein [Deltaproteobacteria bacterium]